MQKSTIYTRKNAGCYSERNDAGKKDGLTVHFLKAANSDDIEIRSATLYRDGDVVASYGADKDAVILYFRLMKEMENGASLEDASNKIVSNFPTGKAKPSAPVTP